MLRLDIARLEREGSVVIRAEVPPEDPVWTDSDLVFEGPLKVAVRAKRVPASGEVVVRGRVEGVLAGACRRCLEALRSEVDEELTLVFALEEELTDEHGEVRPIPKNTRDIDLGAAIREELILAHDPFMLCKPDCRGLCPRCGANLNVETCGCVVGESDSRWDALRSLKNE
jgi:uncharacterized protein